jgi:alpha-L-fucosidase
MIRNTNVENNNMPRFEPTVDSLMNYECPAWFKDAKFGIYIHWSVYSVAEAGDWLPREMYEQGSKPYQAMCEKYGHPSKFGYKDLVGLWKAEKFDPDAMLRLFKRAGARYFAPCAVHHDNFDLWNSKHTRWNAVNMGPGKDLIGMLRTATLNAGLRFGVTTHLERTWSWLQTNKGADRTGPLKGVPYDGNDPAFQDLYLAPDSDTSMCHPRNPPRAWREHWALRMKDLIDNYHPDHLYFDGAVPFQGDDRARSGLDVISHYYNHNMSVHGGQMEGVMCIKNYRMHGYYFDGIATLDFEWDQSKNALYDYWQNDASIASSWGYCAGLTYFSAETLIHKLVDVVSKNGNMLLSVPPRANGSLDDQAVTVLEGMGDWLALNGEAIYGTEPWWPAYRSIPDGVRFTRKGDTLYAIILKWPETAALLLPVLGTGEKGSPIRRIEMVGQTEPLRYAQDAEALVVTLPQKKPDSIAWALRLDMPEIREI